MLDYVYLIILTQHLDYEYIKVFVIHRNDEIRALKFVLLNLVMTCLIGLPCFALK